MNKLLKITPLFLVIFYIYIERIVGNTNIKLYVLLSILIATIFIYYYLIRKKLIPKRNLYLFFLFILISICISAYYYYNV